jgi:hypothetical protein
MIIISNGKESSVGIQRILLPKSYFSIPEAELEE